MDNITQIFKALTDPKRIEIIELLKQGNLCTCHISEKLNISHTKTSYHMKIMVDANIVKTWYEGKWTHYQLNQDFLNEIKEILEKIFI